MAFSYQWFGPSSGRLKELSDFLAVLLLDMILFLPQATTIFCTGCKVPFSSPVLTSTKAKPKKCFQLHLRELVLPGQGAYDQAPDGAGNIFRKAV